MGALKILYLILVWVQPTRCGISIDKYLMNRHSLLIKSARMELFPRAQFQHLRVAKGV